MLTHLRPNMRNLLFIARPGILHPDAWCSRLSTRIPDCDGAAVEVWAAVDSVSRTPRCPRCICCWPWCV